jgi:hypothetical protein
MGPSKRKSRQMSDDEPKFAVRSILDENKTKYLVDWEDINGQSFDPTWEPKNFVTPDLIPEWEELKEQRKKKKKKRKSTTSRPSTSTTGKAIQLDEDDDENNGNDEEEESENDQQSSATATASGSGSGSGSRSAMKPSIILRIPKQKPVVEVTPPAARVPEPTKKGPGRPRKSEVSSVQPGEDEVVIAPKKPGQVGRPRKSNPAPEVAEDEEQDDDIEDSERPSITIKISKRKRDVPEVVNISSDEDSDVPIRGTKRQRKIMPDSSDQVQPAPEEVQSVVGPRKRGRPRKSALPASAVTIPMTPAATSRTGEIGTTEIEDSEMYDPAAAQLQRETKSARKQSPSRQLSPRQPSPEFDEDVSDFRSSQIVRGTQPEPPRADEMTELIDSQSMVDAAAASSLSAKNSPFEPDATSGSTFDNTTVNSSSDVHTLLNPRTRRFGPDAVVPDSQSYLDGSSLHISEQRVEADQTMNDQMDIVEDASTESQIVVEPEQTVARDLPVPESSIGQVRSILSLFFHHCSIMLLCYLIDLCRVFGRGMTRHDRLG